MMDLESAIRHCEEVAKTNERICATELSVGLPDIYRHKDEAKKCANEHRQLAEWLKELKAYREQSGDAISREAAIKAIEALQRPIMREESNYYQFKFSGMSEALGAVENLPSVTTQQRMGRWIEKEEEGDAEPFIIWECSECHCVCEDGKPSYKYCPQCGANMEAEDI